MKLSIPRGQLVKAGNFKATRRRSGVRFRVEGASCIFVSGRKMGGRRYLELLDFVDGVVARAEVGEGRDEVHVEVAVVVLQPQQSS